MTLFLVMIWSFACLTFFTNRPLTAFVFAPIGAVLVLAGVLGAILTGMAEGFFEWIWEQNL